MTKGKKIQETQKFYVQKEGIEASIFMYGIVGDSDMFGDNEEQNMTDIEFVKTLDMLKSQGVQEVHLRINSPGGYTSHGLAMITAIKSSPFDIHTWNDGQAFSMAADIWLCVPIANRHMAKNSSLMIHAPSIGCFGTAKDMRETADRLDTIAEASIQMMAEATGKTIEDIRQQFYDYADHHFTYNQCLDMGLFQENSDEDYEVENPATITEPMKMTFFKSFINKLTQPNVDEIPNNSFNKIEEMTTEALKTAIQDGTLNLGDVEKIIADEKAKQPLTVADAEKLLTDALAPVKAENEALKIEVEALKKSTHGVAPHATAATGLGAEAANDPDTQKVDLRAAVNESLKAGKQFGGDDI